MSLREHTRKIEKDLDLTLKGNAMRLLKI